MTWHQEKVGLRLCADMAAARCCRLHKQLLVTYERHQLAVAVEAVLAKHLLGSDEPSTTSLFEDEVDGFLPQQKTEPAFVWFVARRLELV